MAKVRTFGEETVHEARLVAVRNKKIGFVFQGFNLLSRTAALDNVELRLLYGGGKLRAQERRKLARGALTLVGLAEFAPITIRISFPAGSSSALRSRVR